MKVDVSEEDENVMERIAKEAWGVWDGVDIIVNNAGYVYHYLLDICFQEFDSCDFGFRFGTVGSLEEAG